MCRRRRAHPPAGPSKFPDAGADAYLLVSQARLDHQMTILDALDSKAATQLGAAVAEAGFLLALLAVRPPADHTPSVLSWMLLALAGTLTLVVVGCASRAGRVEGWDGYPDPGESWKVAHGKEPIAWELANTLDAAYESNEPGQQRKAKLVKRGGRFLMANTLLTTAAALALTFT